MDADQVLPVSSARLLWVPGMGRALAGSPLPLRSSRVGVVDEAVVLMEVSSDGELNGSTSKSGEESSPLASTTTTEMVSVELSEGLRGREAVRKELKAWGDWAGYGAGSEMLQTAGPGRGMSRQ